MSSPAARVIHRRDQERYRKRHKGDPDLIALHAAEEREHRRSLRVEKNLLEDNLARAADHERRAVEQTALDVLAQAAAAAAAEPEAEENEEASLGEDDFDELPTDADCDDEAWREGEWDCERVVSYYKRARASNRRFRQDTGLPLAVFDAALNVVLPHYEKTRYDGKPRAREVREQRMPDHLQFYLLLVWYKEVRASEDANLVN